MDYRVVDVFASRPLTGNPLTVFPDAGHLDAATMQAISQETNHSETTFITGHAADGTPQVRIFTPKAELPFAGHPTLGTAHVADAEALDLAVGRIPVHREGDLLWMTQNPATFGPTLDTAAMGKALGVEVQAAQVVSTGTPMALVQVADSDAVRGADLDPRRYDGPDVACVYVFADDDPLHARSFGHFVGVAEDAATGSAAGPLAAWLHRSGRLSEELIVRQGVEMGRDARLHIRGTADAPEVGGGVVDVAQGKFSIAM